MERVVQGAFAGNIVYNFITLDGTFHLLLQTSLCTMGITGLLEISDSCGFFTSCYFSVWSDLLLNGHDNLQYAARGSNYGTEAFNFLC